MSTASACRDPSACSRHHPGWWMSTVPPLPTGLAHSPPTSPCMLRRGGLVVRATCGLRAVLGFLSQTCCRVPDSIVCPAPKRHGCACRCLTHVAVFFPQDVWAARAMLGEERRLCQINRSEGVLAWAGTTSCSADCRQEL